MEETNLLQEGNILKVVLDVSKIDQYLKYPASIYSATYVIRGSTEFQMKMLLSTFSRPGYTCGSQFTSFVFIRFVKRHPDDDLNYTIKFSSTKLDLNEQCFTNNDGTWHLVKECEVQCGVLCTIDVKVQMDVVPSASSFSPLHEDTELLDFELQGADGSVHFHKVVLAACSPVLRTMLGGKWRETTEGRIEVPGTSKKTLQDLKNYMYLRNLPDEDIERLLVLALFYMMPDLEQQCVHKLIATLTPQNTCDLLLFAGEHKTTKLLFAILECLDNHIVKLQEVRNHSLTKGKLTSDE